VANPVDVDLERGDRQADHPFELVSRAGARELLTSCFVDLDGSPAPFYERLGFVATGDLDVDGETVLRLELRSDDATPDPGTANDHG